MVNKAGRKLYDKDRKERYRVKMLELAAGVKENLAGLLGIDGKEKEAWLLKKVAESPMECLTETRYPMPVAYFVPWLFGIEYSGSLLLRNERNGFSLSLRGNDVCKLLRAGKVKVEDRHVWDGMSWRCTTMAYCYWQEWVHLLFGVMPCLVADLLTSSRLLAGGVVFDSLYGWKYPAKRRRTGAPVADILGQIGANGLGDMGVNTIPCYPVEPLLEWLCVAYGYKWLPSYGGGLYGVDLYTENGKIASFGGTVKRDCYLDVINWLLDRLGVQEMVEGE